jgi:hypothetical protein
MKKRKEYKKPQVVEVTLTVMNPILGGCSATEPTALLYDCPAWGGTACISP